MIACPKCSSTLPDWAQSCQFCGADVTKVARPAPVLQQKRASGLTPQWVWPTYYALSALFTLEGGADILRVLVDSRLKVMGEPVGLAAFSYVGLAIGAFTALLGIGLLARVELVRGIVNFFCGLRILFGLLGLLGGLGGTLLFGAAGLIVVFMNLVSIATAALMIYLIGETEKYPPNF